MARKSIIEREKKRRLLSSKYSGIRKFLKDKVKSSDSFEQKLFYQSQLQKLPRNSSFSRLLCISF
jgi:small subunit ribosomal protein S14